MKRTVCAGVVYEMKDSPFSGEAPAGLVVSDPDASGMVDLLRVVSAGEPGLDLVPLSSESLVDIRQRVRVASSLLVGEIGAIGAVLFEAILRRMALAEVERYYRHVHRPQQDRPFVPGESRIGYAGWVFDEREMTNLANAGLDFWLTAGRFSSEFESKLARMLGVRRALLVNSGSSANLVAFFSLTSLDLKDSRIKKGDEVITVAAGFPTTVNPIIQYGAHPVFVDVKVDDGTYNVDVSALEEARSSKTRAVMLAHTLGNPFDLKAVTEFCSKHDLYLIEDNCDALGSRYDGRLTGSFGDIGTSSFYPPHHLTMGEGGAVYTNSARLARIAESFRDWGRDCWCASGKDDTCSKRFGWQLGTLPEGYDHKYTYSNFGFNLKVTDMQAAVGIAQLDKLEEFTEKRKKNWQFLRDALADLEDYFLLPNATKGADPSWFGFLLSVRETAPFTRDQVTSFLEENRIQTRLLFAGNLVRQPAFNEMRATGQGYRAVGELPNTDYIMSNSFWVGVFPGMKPAMLEYMVECLNRFVGQSRAKGKRKNV